MHSHMHMHIVHVHVHVLYMYIQLVIFSVHSIVKKYTADYDKALIFNKVHHELNQVNVHVQCMYMRARTTYIMYGCLCQ